MAQPTTMRAWQYTHRLASKSLESSLTLTSIPALASPPPSSKILVKVLSAALNPVDYKLPEAGILAHLITSIPATPGLDFSGQIVSVPDPNNTGFTQGQRVFGAFSTPNQHGTLGEYIVVPASECAPLPEGVNVHDAAAAGVAASTAHKSLLPGNIKPGSKVFINGGSGGVGTWAIQLAKLQGAEVTTTCSTPNVALCKSLGADTVLDYKNADVLAELVKGGQIYDLAIDNVGSPANLYERSDKFLKPGGAFSQVAMGVAFAEVVTLLKRLFLPRILGGGSRRFTFVQANNTTQVFSEVGKLMAEGKIKVVIDEVFEYKDVPKAFEKLKTGRARGKIVVDVANE